MLSTCWLALAHCVGPVPAWRDSLWVSAQQSAAIPGTIPVPLQSQTFPVVIDTFTSWMYHVTNIAHLAVGHSRLPRPPSHFQMSSQIQAVPVNSDVTIIESEIKIEFFLENRIESKSIFGWYLYSILTHSYIGEDNALQRVQRMTVRAAESWIRRLNYMNCMPRRPHGMAASIDVV